MAQVEILDAAKRVQVKESGESPIYDLEGVEPTGDEIEKQLPSLDRAKFSV